MNRFATTHWTAILDAAQFDGSKSADALADLCRSYWYPLYAFSRSMGDAHSEAQDVTQGFFQHLIEKRLIAEVHPSRGRFRSFLVTCFKNYRSVQVRRERARKRGGEWTLTSYEALNAADRFASELLEATTPDTVYDRNWAITVLHRTYSRLQTEYAAAGKERVFALLRGFIQGAGDGPKYDEFAAKIEKTKDALKMEVSRMRRRFSELLRDVVGETVDNASDVEDELRYLLTLLSR